MLFDAGLPVVGVPKTIDNDISSTDRTFGFDTAVGVATEAMDRLKTTAESHQRVLVVEVMASPVPSRKCRTPRVGRTSWASTPATAIVSPDAVDKIGRAHV